MKGSLCCFLHEPQCLLAVFFRGGATEDCSVFSFSWEGFEAQRDLRWGFLLPGGDKGVSVKVLFC